MLRKIAFKNYRCFEDSELDIRQIAIIVGNNNAGKSTVIEAYLIFSSRLSKVEKSIVTQRLITD